MTIHASRLRTLLACAASLALLAGCSADDEPAKPEPVVQKPTAKSAAPKPARPAPAPVVKREPPKTISEQLEGQVEAPDWYPSDAPLYPGAKLNRVGWAGSRVSGIFSTTDSTDDVSSWMTDFLASENWRNVTQVDMPNGKVMQASKSGRTIAVMVSALDSDGTKVTLVNVAADP
jgi:hypothetical protein